MTRYSLRLGVRLYSYSYTGIAEPHHGISTDERRRRCPVTDSSAASQSGFHCLRVERLAMAAHPERSRAVLLPAPCTESDGILSAPPAVGAGAARQGGWADALQC